MTERSISNRPEKMNSTYSDLLIEAISSISFLAPWFACLSLLFSMLEQAITTSSKHITTLKLPTIPPSNDPKMKIRRLSLVVGPGPGAALLGLG